MAEKPILALRKNESVSTVRDIKPLFSILHESTQLERRSTDIDGIRQDFISVTQAEIPLEFLFATGLTEMKWQQIYTPQGMSSVYLGVKKQELPRIEFDQADAIISINSAINEETRLVQPDSISLSLVIPDSQKRNRVVVASYDARFLENRILAVSIADDERPIFSKESHPDDQMMSDGRLLEIPTEYDDPISRFSDLFVSRAMSIQANKDIKMVEGYKFRDYWVMNFKGYFIGAEGEDRTIGFGENPNKFSWKVSVPDQLVPAKR